MRTFTIAAIACLILTLCGAAQAGLITVGDWDFADNQTPAGFTEVGNPTYSGGQLVVDGNDAINLLTTPLWAADEFVVEAIISARAFGDDDFVSNGNGLWAIQLSAKNGGRWGSKVAGWDFIGHLAGTTDTKVAVAFVCTGGVATFYLDGVPDSADVGVVPGLPAGTVLTIGARDGGVEFFNGSIDRVRVSTINGPFDPADLLTHADGTIPEPATLGLFVASGAWLLRRRRAR
ncbi:hypothetical protein LCGC14_0017320 [marine sediment metagenome]|uniref:PEP-CTERM protein-sorting domain-containing protein n=1 Tax=marine sediment metagenome TaxID=412755 RepID=A0A0F9W4H0_9ZZZZ